MNENKNTTVIALLVLNAALLVALLVMQGCEMRRSGLADAKASLGTTALDTKIDKLQRTVERGFDYQR